MRPVVPFQVPTMWCHWPTVSATLELKLLQLAPPKLAYAPLRRSATPLRQPEFGSALLTTVWSPANASGRTHASSE